jgi:hypothetical protein
MTSTLDPDTLLHAIENDDWKSVSNLILQNLPLQVAIRNVNTNVPLPMKLTGVSPKFKKFLFSIPAINKHPKAKVRL